MKQSSVVLAILTFALYPWLVETYNLRALNLLDPSPGLDFFDSGDTISSLIRRERDFFNHAFFRTNSPHYDIVDNDEKFEVRLDIPNVKPDDLKVNVEGRLLTISGRGELKEEGYSYSSSFSESFTLDPAVEADKLTATVNNDGRLTVSAPKDPKLSEKNQLRPIPVTYLDGSDLLELPPEPVPVRGPEKNDRKGPDPFHVQQKVAKARQQQAMSENEHESKAAEPGYYKMAELRRRR